MKFLELRRVPRTTYVATLAEWNAALAAGKRDLTLTAVMVAPAGGLVLPRYPEGLTLRCSGAGLLVRGSRNGDVIGSTYSGSGGRITLKGFRVDGGWRTYQLEDLNSCCNYNFHRYDYVRLENCVTCWSLSTGFTVEQAGVLEVEGCVSYMTPRDFCWARGGNDVTVRGNLVQHCGDDGLGAHLQPGAGPTVRSMIYENNTLRDCNGMKLHAGSVSGTINGKPGRVSITGNTFEACSLYAIHGEDNPVEQTQDPINITFSGNTVNELRRTTPFSPGQEINRAIIMQWPGRSFTAVDCGGNTFTRTSAVQGARLQDVFDWARPGSLLRPAGVPGINDFAGGFSKTASLPDATLDLANVRTDIGGVNPTAVNLADNVWNGAWT